MPGCADGGLRVMLAPKMWMCCPWGGSISGQAEDGRREVIHAAHKTCWRRSTRGCSISGRAEDGIGGVVLAPRICGAWSCGEEEEPVAIKEEEEKETNMCRNG
jgi:hypothetical protein